MLDVREHFRNLDIDSPVTPEEMKKLTDLAYKLIPVCVQLENYAKMIAGVPVLN